MTKKFLNCVYLLTKANIDGTILIYIAFCRLYVLGSLSAFLNGMGFQKMLCGSVGKRAAHTIIMRGNAK